jgi:dTMP kinase
LFITFEGPEGSGKTTQIGLLAATLVARGHHVLTTREPGGTRIGDAVRSVLLNSSHTEMSERAEALLFNAARAQLVDQVILPALARGDIVLCDRYGDSTLAYQGYGHDQPLEPLRRIIDYATLGLLPDLTIYLDLDVETGLGRKRGGAAGEWNRMEEKALAFHQAVRQGYLAMAAESARWLVVDAGQPPERINAQILERLAALRF